MAAVLAFLVTLADYNFARIARQSAQETYAKYGQGPGALWFEGHWGWQYYMEELGATALTAGQSPPPAGDFIAAIFNNTNVGGLNKRLAPQVDVLSIGGEPWLSISSEDLGAGFYSSMWGPVPFAFGKSPAEKVDMFVVGPAPEAEPPKGP